MDPDAVILCQRIAYLDGMRFPDIPDLRPGSLKKKVRQLPSSVSAASTVPKASVIEIRSTVKIIWPVVRFQLIVLSVNGNPLPPIRLAFLPIIAPK